VSNEQEHNNQQQLHELYHSLPKDMPPPELDARILDAAYQSVTSKRSRVTSMRRRKQSQYVWLKPLAYAAVLVLCLGVVLRIQIDQQKQMTPSPVVPETFDIESADDTMSVPQPATIVAPPAVSASAPMPSRSQNESLQRAGEMKSALMRARSEEASRQSDEASARMKKELDINQPATLSINANMGSVAEPVMATESTMQSTPDMEAEQAVTDMLKLYQDKKFDRLAVQLKEFVAKYPGYVLPAELNQFAKERL